MSIIIGLAALTVAHCLPAQTTPKADPPAAVTHVDDERINTLAAGLFIANEAYDEACKMPNPAATMDDICDAWPEIAPQVLKVAKTTPEQAEVLTGAVADWLWAYTAIESARVEAGDGYGYLLDFLAEKVRAGADPHVIRTTALDVPRRIRELAEQAGGDE